MTQNKKSFHRY